MGLDTFAMRGATEAPDELFEGVGPLCGGMFSGGTGTASIRGKVYADLVERITGETLYQERIPNDIVGRMAAALEQAAARGETSLPEDYYEVSPEEVAALAQWFRRAHESRCDVVNWW